MTDLDAVEERIAQLEIQIRIVRLLDGLMSTPRTEGCTNGCTGACPDPTGNCTYGCTNGCTNGCTGACAREVTTLPSDLPVTENEVRAAPARSRAAPKGQSRDPGRAGG